VVISGFIKPIEGFAHECHPKRYYIAVFPVPWFVVVLYLLAYAVAGMVIGALTGWLASLITKRGTHGILEDAFFGSLGYLVGFIGCVLMPWPRNTVVEPLEGGGSVATTMSTYQHPERVAIVVAVIAPLLYELYRPEAHRSKLRG
jgi:hypothetical protein